MARLVALQLILALLVQKCFSADCFFPNGNLAGADVPCDPDAAISACCAGKAGVVCLENNLCQEASGHLSRGSCTDEDWNSGACPRRCLDTDNNGVGMRSCAAQTNDDTSYCCWKAADSCCKDGVGRFNVLPSNPDVWARFNESADEFRVVGTRYNSETSTLSTSSSISSTLPSGTALPSADPSSTEASTTTAGSPAPANDSTEGGLATGAKIGIGVGVSVGGILAIVAAFLVWRRRKTKRAPPPYHDVPEIQSTPIQELPGYKPISPPAPPPVELPNNERR